MKLAVRKVLSRPNSAPFPSADVNEKPTQLCLLGSTVAENKPAGYQIGQLVVEDPDHPPRSCNPIAPHTELPFNDKCVVSLSRALMCFLSSALQNSNLLSMLHQ